MESRQVYDLGDNLFLDVLYPNKSYAGQDIADNNVHNILLDKSQICGLDSSKIGTPFLWDGKNCILGYVDVIKFFQQEIVRLNKK